MEQQVGAHPRYHVERSSHAQPARLGRQHPLHRPPVGLVHLRVGQQRHQRRPPVHAHLLGLQPFREQFSAGADRADGTAEKAHLASRLRAAREFER